MRIEKSNFATICSGLSSLFSRRTTMANIELQIEVPDPTYIYCDATLIGQMMANLLLNAIEAAEKSEGEKWVSITVKQSESDLFLYIRDSGPGVSPEIQPRIMDQFFTTKPPNADPGLGLAIAKTIAENHNGSIEYVPEEPHTCFKAVIKKDARVDFHKGFKVLVVEDEVEINDLLCLELRSNFSVITAFDGEEAIKLLQENPDIAVIITDLVMPKKDGSEVMDYVLENDLRIPIIVVSGYAAKFSHPAVVKIFDKPCSKSTLFNELLRIEKSAAKK